MKKLSVIIALLIVPMVCNAQLSVINERNNARTLASTRMGMCELRENNGFYFILAPTTNRFDHIFSLQLGEGKESATKTLEDLLALCGNLAGKSVVIQNGFDICTINDGGLGSLAISQSGYTGYVGLSKAELKKFVKAIKK